MQADMRMSVVNELTENMTTFTLRTELRIRAYSVNVFQ